MTWRTGHIRCCLHLHQDSNQSSHLSCKSTSPKWSQPTWTHLLDIQWNSIACLFGIPTTSRSSVQPWDPHFHCNCRSTYIYMGDVNSTEISLYIYICTPRHHRFWKRYVNDTCRSHWGSRSAKLVDRTIYIGCALKPISYAQSSSRKVFNIYPG